MPGAPITAKRKSWGLRAVVFDFDGTIADTRINFGLMRQRVAEVLEALGAWEEGLEGRYVLEMVEAAVDVARQRGLDAQAVRAAAEEEIRAVEYEACGRARLCAGAAEAVARLKAAGLRVGVITRNCGAAVEMVLSRHPLPLDAVVPRDSVLRPKPHPAHLMEALNAMGVAPSQAALVGDHVTDVQCARAAKVALAVAVAGASSSPSELRAAGADFVACNLCEAADFLLSHGDSLHE
jgi:phosphoglycolate phosphatase